MLAKDSQMHKKLKDVSPFLGLLSDINKKAALKKNLSAA